MLTGFNTNITYKEEIYHVQTEDSGLRNPVITTLLYKGGVILASKKTSYKDILSGHEMLSHNVKEKIKKLMAEQHRAMIEDLFAGKFDSIIKGGKPGFTDITSADEGTRAQPVIKDHSSESGGVTVESKMPVVKNNVSEKKIETSFSGEMVDEGKGTGPEKKSAHREGARTLDDILLEHILKRKKG